MRYITTLWMWFLTLLMLAVLAPIIYFDSWLERRERKRREKFNG